jgi:protein-L-isoaspartate(D-aspartate) O-methyltransferase
MPQLDFISLIHTRTPRNYLSRVVGVDKAECAAVARRFDRDYWDGDRKHGYGGYRYDGRWRLLAEKLVQHYGLKPGQRVLDIGCGKGYLLYDLLQTLPGLEVAGLDISTYAIGHAPDEVRPFLRVGDAVELPWPDQSFDLVVSINTLHNLHNYRLVQALREIERVARGGKYLVVDAYRNEREKVNLLYWQLTCVCFYTPREWEWLFEQSNYRGDYGFVFYE